MQRHIAFFNIPAVGHVAPSLGLVAELVGRGHRVTYATTGELVDLVAPTGAQTVVYESTITDIPAIIGDGGPDWLYRVFLAAMAESRATLPALGAHFADDVPDLVAYDASTVTTGRVLARRWRRPAVELSPTYASNEVFSLATIPEHLVTEQVQQTVVQVGTELASFLSDHGMGDVPIWDFLRNEEGSRIVFLPRSFQVAGESFGERYTFVGPCLPADPATGWEPPPGAGPVVLVSIGTVFNQRTEFFRECVRAFTGTPWHVVLLVGRAADPADLGPLPGNIEAHRWLAQPLTAVLRHASAFICHAGMGSVMEGLHAGVPLVTVPLVADQHAIADRVAELGVGRALRLDEVTADSLHAAVSAVSADALVGERVRRLQADTRGAGGAARAADVLEQALSR